MRYDENALQRKRDGITHLLLVIGQWVMTLWCKTSNSHSPAVGYMMWCSDTGRESHSQAVHQGIRYDVTLWRKRRSVTPTCCSTWDKMWSECMEDTNTASLTCFVVGWDGMGWDEMSWDYMAEKQCPSQAIGHGMRYNETRYLMGKMHIVTHWLLIMW